MYMYKIRSERTCMLSFSLQSSGAEHNNNVGLHNPGLKYWNRVPERLGGLEPVWNLGSRPPRGPGYPCTRVICTFWVRLSGLPVLRRGDNTAGGRT